ncbi:MAG: helix-turn-helix domain-containing protein [Lachnospiraceae bacterium]
MNNTFKNSYKVEDTEIFSLSVYNVGYQKCEPLYQWGPGVRDHFLIHHVVSGKGYYYTKDKTYTLYAGDTFIIYPYTEVSYFADENEPWEYYWVGFAGSDAPIILESTRFSPDSPVISNSEKKAQITEQLLKIYQVRGTEILQAVQMTGELYLTLSLFMDEKPPHPSTSDFYRNYAKKGIDYIAFHYSFPITVDDIATYVGISRSHLYRAFMQTLGLSPKQYLSDFRLKQACHLLKHSDLSITAVANSVGYENNLYFSKMFHKKKGMTPSEYIQKKRK